MEQKTQKKKKKWLLFQDKTLFMTVLFFVVVVGGLIAAYIGCDAIARRRGMDQFEDAANTVIDQINSKFERDGEVLESMAEILAESDAFSGETPDEDALRDSLREFKPLQQTMNLRILLPSGLIYLPDDSVVLNQFNFEEEKQHGKHISHRFVSRREGFEDTQLIAHFVPVIKKTEQNPEGETVAMLYGVTALNRLPSLLRTDNIYNGNASIMIFDVQSEGHETIMDTWHKSEGGKLGKFEDFQDHQDVASEILSLHTGYLRVRSQTTGEWVYLYYAPARGDVSDQWSICIAVPSDVAFGNVTEVQIVFVIVGVVYLIALVLYFLWMRRDAKRAVAKNVEHAVLEERLHKAEAAERAKTTFLSNMSHDIRTPMNAILGFTTLAETNIDNKEKVQDYLKKILSSGNHLLSLINDILDMSRIESGKLNIEEKPCSISDIFRDMRNIIQTQMKSKQLNFFMDTLDVVDEEIFCDKLHVNQVLLNLLSNAIKFTPSGGSVSLSIRQKPGAPTGYGAYEIRVKDTGIGMSKEFAVHIFEPFERERTSTVSGIQGTGLGMAITKNIVDTMGGTIELETEQGRGSEFIINLQFRLQSDQKHVETIRELEGMRALVVDDSFSTCDSVSKMLIRIGMRSEWTMYGKEAVLRARQAVDIGDEFSAYIIDWVMPDLSGFEIVRQIRAIVGESTPIIILTAYDLSAIMDEAKDLGVTAYVNKPIFLSELRDTLVSVVEKRGSGKNDEEKQDPYAALQGKHVLLVEDNELNREIAEELLSEHGFIVESAEDGTVAVEKVKASEGKYDLILMDVQMPIMNGYEATKRIRALDDERLNSIPIVAMTANAFDEDRKKAADCGMNAHVAKPIDLERLLEVIFSLLCEKNGENVKN